MRESHRLAKLPYGLSWSVLLLVALSVFAWAPLVGPPYFLNAHDAPHGVFFLNQFDQAIRDGVLYPRWGVDFALGYGYPLFNIYSTLAFYVAEVFHLLGAGLTAAVKLTYILGFILSGLTMYAFAKRVFGAEAGVLAGVVYIYVPYHLLDVYVRSGFAEFFALVFLPLILLLFYDLIEQRRVHHLALTGLAYSGLLLTHAATAFIFTMLLVPYVAFLIFSRIRIGRVELLRLIGLSLGAAALALALSSIFLLPMLMEKGYIVESQWTQGSFGYAKHFVYPSQLFSPFWGYGYAGEGLQDEMSLQLGVLATVLALVGVTYSLYKRVNGKGQIAFFLVASLLIILAMMPAALPLWEALPLAAFVQFPWRLLGLAALTVSFLSGSAVHAFSGTPSSEYRGRCPGLVVLSLIVILASHSYTLPEYTAPSPRSEQPVAVIDFESFYPPDRVGMTAWVTEQPHDTPLVEQYLAGKPLIKARALDAGATVEMVRHGGASEEIRVNSPAGTEVQLYTYYYPGWRGYVDGQEVETYPTGPHGLITLQVPPGEHQVMIRFGDTLVRVVGAAISLLGFLLVLLVLIGDTVRRRRLT
jgi:uncharacterized membrane protein